MLTGFLYEYVYRTLNPSILQPDESPLNLPMSILSNVWLAYNHGKEDMLINLQ